MAAEDLLAEEHVAGEVNISVAGDLLGHLIGTVTRDHGKQGVKDAAVEAAFSTPAGPVRQGARTDENGFFSVDMPACPIGPVVVSATGDNHLSELTVDSGDIAKALTPRLGRKAARIPLEGQWDFQVDPPAEFPRRGRAAKWGKTKVPGHWEMEGFVARTGKAAYRRAFTIPKAWKGKRIKFRAEGIYSFSQVWVNGVRVGSHDGGATPFELDITDAARAGGRNVIAIVVEDHSPAGDIDAMTFYAHLNMAGIWRPLEVFCVEPLHVCRLALATDLDPSLRRARLQVDLDILNEQGVDVSGAAVKLRIIDPAGEVLPLEGLSGEVSLSPWQRKRLSLQADVLSPQPWSAESPRLYVLQAHLEVPKSNPTIISQTFGFRKVQIKGRTFTINGKAVKLFGACRHDAHPLLGRAITPDIARQDAELMKGCNMNAFRTSHYPPHQAALEMADHLGLYVQDEAPACFVSVNWFGDARDANTSFDLSMAPLMIRLTSELIERDRNHPSVVIWSMCNESVWGPIFEMAHKFALRSDPTRPTSAGQSANLQIATFHNPTSMQRMRDTAELPMPVLFDEGLAIFQGMNAQAQGMELDPGLRDYWVSVHFEPVEAIYASEHQFGAMIWAWADDAFLARGRGMEYGRLLQGKPYCGQPVYQCRSNFVDDVYGMRGRGIVGDPMWGVVEGWRRPRPEWWLCKKLFSPIQIKEQPLAPRSTITIPVRNRNAFVNLSSYTCKWRLGGQKGQVRPDVPPMSQGVLRIAPKTRPKADDVLVLEFFDDTGRSIDGYRLPFRPHEEPRLPATGTPARFVEEIQTLDFGSIIRLEGIDSQLAFDRTGGGMVRGLAGNVQVLRGGPTLQVMKNSAPPEPFPINWAFVSEQHRTQGKAAVLEWNGRYGTDFDGGFVIRMDDGGNVRIDYRFTYNGPGLTAREIGIGLELPLGCDTLQWDRKADWSYYPDDHIGRLEGSALAHPKVRQGVPPGTRPFGLDDHPWGCNDFRSVKRNIYWASLTDNGGAGVRIVSDSTQHVRATVGVRTVSLKVLDYYGGSAAGTGEWDGVYGMGKEIKPGDVVQGTVRLQLLSGKA